MEDEKKKKPMVAADAANPAPAVVDAAELIKPQPVVRGWAGNADGNNDLPTFNEHQLRNEQTAPNGVDGSKLNKAPGSGEVKLTPSASRWGVLQGAPSQVVLQHMIDDIPVETEEQRKKREKAEKRNALFAALGDGISALSNLYFTTKGSPSADQSKSLSKAESERKDKARKERESNIDRRIRLLKEQRAGYYNMQGMKIRKQMAEAQKAYQEAKTAAERKKAEDYMKYLTQRNQILKEEKEAEANRKAELDRQEKERKDALNKSAVGRNNAASAKYASDAKVNQQKGAAFVRDANDRISKRRSGGSQRQYNPANDPGMQRVVEKDRKTGTTTTYYEPRQKPAKPAPKTGSGSAKSKFSIHK